MLKSENNKKFWKAFDRNVGVLKDPTFVDLRDMHETVYKMCNDGQYPSWEEAQEKSPVKALYHEAIAKIPITFIKDRPSRILKIINSAFIHAAVLDPDAWYIQKSSTLARVASLEKGIDKLCEIYFLICSCSILPKEIVLFVGRLALSQNKELPTRFTDLSL